jgi:hypothetical protein
MWPFKPKSAPKVALPKLIYKSGEAFFEMQCKYGHTDIVEGQGIVAIMLDAKEEFGTEVAVKIQPNGCQLATIRVAATDGGFRSFAEAASAKGDRLKPGDLVVWVPMTHMKRLADTAGDHRQGWIGLIVAKVAPETDPANNELSLLCRY